VTVALPKSSEVYALPLPTVETPAAIADMENQFLGSELIRQQNPGRICRYVIA
jgi:hypothetical protein